MGLEDEPFPFEMVPFLGQTLIFGGMLAICMILYTITTTNIIYLPFPFHMVTRLKLLLAF